MKVHLPACPASFSGPRSETNADFAAVSGALQYTTQLKLETTILYSLESLDVHIGAITTPELQTTDVAVRIGHTIVASSNSSLSISCFKALRLRKQLRNSWQNQDSLRGRLRRRSQCTLRRNGQNQEKSTTALPSLSMTAEIIAGSTKGFRNTEFTSAREYTEFFLRGLHVFYFLQLWVIVAHGDRQRGRSHWQDRESVRHAPFDPRQHAMIIASGVDGAFRFPERFLLLTTLLVLETCT